MKFYSAGNFVLLSNVENESRFKEMSENRYGEGSYKRLTSFFFDKETKVVMDVKRESEGHGCKFCEHLAMCVCDN